MKPSKLVAAALVTVGVAALGACHKNNNPQSAATGSSTIENSAGSYAPNTSNVPGTNTDAVGVGSTGVSPNEIGNAPTPDTTTPNAEALEPTAPARSTP
ncbi:MAG: hypothetical protein JWN48_1664 [Myxococcaceae bacterium]|nr:hypothetical protein [Myxococcaceae bacterium]